MRNIALFDLSKLKIEVNNSKIDIFYLENILNKDLDHHIYEKTPITFYMYMNYFQYLNNSEEFENNFNKINSNFLKKTINELYDFSDKDEVINDEELISKVDNFMDIYQEIPNRADYWNNLINQFKHIKISELNNNSKFLELNKAFIIEFNDLFLLIHDIEIDLKKTKLSTKTSPAKYVLDF